MPGGGRLARLRVRAPRCAFAVPWRGAANCSNRRARWPVAARPERAGGAARGRGRGVCPPIGGGGRQGEGGGGGGADPQGPVGSAARAGRLRGRSGGGRPWS